MLLHQIYRWRIAVGLFVLLVFGVAEYAESGLFRRCRRRVRCRPVVCQPVCGEPVIGEPPTPGECAGKLCPQEIVAKVMDPTNPSNCLSATYRCDDCGSPSDVLWTSNCNHPYPRSCAEPCTECVVGAIEIPIPPIGGLRQTFVTEYVSEDFEHHGLPINGKVKAGPNYKPETIKSDKTGMNGIIIEMPLLDDEDEETGEKKKIRLKWLTPRPNTGNRKPAGIGVEVTDGKPKDFEIRHRKVTDYVYSLLLKKGGGNSPWRHYVVYLQNPAVNK